MDKGSLVEYYRILRTDEKRDEKEMRTMWGTVLGSEISKVGWQRICEAPKLYV